MRNAELLSMTTAPAAANFGAYSLEVEPPAENSAFRIEFGQIANRVFLSGVFDLRAGGPLGGQHIQIVDRKFALLEDRQHGLADGTGGADDGNIERFHTFP
jgi:hypothetical protein